MIDDKNFKLWLKETTTNTDETIKDKVSNLRRANEVLPFFNDELYLFELEKNPHFQSWKTGVKSHVRTAIRNYMKFLKSFGEKTNDNGYYNVLSLFSNIGVAEAYLDSIGVSVVLANELIERRARLYNQIYPNTHMICGDITDSNIFNTLIAEAQTRKVDVIMATPPCQGMSTAGQQNDNDLRNNLIVQVIEIVKAIQPRYVFIENVPLFFNTGIYLNDTKKLIPDHIKDNLGDSYTIKQSVVDTKDYSVPQSRERAIMLLTRKDQKIQWDVPEKDKHLITMQDAIGDLPTLDPFISDISEEEMLEIFPLFYERKKEALKISKWHNPPHHIKRQVEVMRHTPSGKTAFDNPIHFPKKENGDPVKGYHNTYKRQNWDTPAYTVTMDNRKISSQNNVHPGRIEVSNDGDNLYSDARVLTLYELMKIMSLPDDWPIPHDVSEAFLRRIIGEGIPPLFVKKVFAELLK